MSTGPAAHPSTDNFIAIFSVAQDEYKKLTGHDVRRHPLALKFDTCRSPEDVSKLLQMQGQALSTFNKGNEALMRWLNPTVNILFILSGTLGEGIGLPFSPAKTIFTGIGVLLGAVKDEAASHDKLIELFERIHCFLHRLESYIRTLLSSEFVELLGKIMAQLLSILALSTKAMTERRIKKVLKRLAGKTDVEDAVSRLDVLTKDENLAVVAKSLELLYKAQRDQLRRDFKTWLSPPDPSVNHNTAFKTQQSGTARWFIEGSTFRDWKEDGSLLWIRGNPGAGKSILWYVALVGFWGKKLILSSSSAVIEDIKNTRETAQRLIAYYYFDYKDASKRDVRGLLASLLFQLGDSSDRCWDLLYRLYTKCRDGSEQPSDADLTKCLDAMLKLPGQVPIFIIMDALDECPSTTGICSAREEVLTFVEDLVGSKHSNLFICITSRPEQDIQTTLSPLTTASCRVSLHDEGGQREDISNYIRTFFDTNKTVLAWRKEDRELVITTLSERAGGMFRWVVCQLDTLRRCFPSSIRQTLKDLPATLDGTYERTLEEIPKEKKPHAHRLFQCLVAARRPLRVEELAEVFAIEFDTDTGLNLRENWRPENPEEAVLSACSTLIAVIEDDGSKIVQFSHFSVKEFLTSDRLRTSEFGNIRHYFVPLDAARSILARACITVLLQLDEKVDKERLSKFPLAFYAADHWVDHAKIREVALQFRDAMEQLFDPRKPYLAAWACWIRDVDQGWVGKSIDDLPEHPPQPMRTALYYAALCGLCDVAEHLIVARAEDTNAKCGGHGSPLHAAVYMGHLDTARVLLNHGADVNLEDEDGTTPLVLAYRDRNLEAMGLLLEHGANPDAQYDGCGSISHDAVSGGNTEVMELLLQHKADVHIRGTDEDKWTLLHWVFGLNAKLVQILLDHGADINAQDAHHKTPLYRAAEKGRLNFVRVLLGHGADVHVRGEGDQTPFQVAQSRGHMEVAQLLLAHGAEKG
ncbi:hypothetical protein BC826DRAFT_1112292 [Russula brevipes]|nr:hypothetical protein BC826DRAFT_1112292 [Russula brevipes]